MAEGALVHPARAALDDADLKRRVAVVLERLLLDDRIGAGIEHGDGDSVAVLRKDLGHAELEAEEIDGHGRLSESRSGGRGPEGPEP